MLLASAEAIARHRPPAMAGLVSSWLPRQTLAFWLHRRQSARIRPEQHYPAPFALLELWQRHGADAVADWLKAEAQSAARLLLTPTSRQLTLAFFLNKKLKNISKQYDFKENNIHGLEFSGNMAAAELRALQERLLSPLRREARRCLEEGIVTDADAVDAGLIFGAGYPPFRGGPLTV